MVVDAQSDGRHAPVGTNPIPNIKPDENEEAKKKKRIAEVDTDGCLREIAV